MTSNRRERALQLYHAALAREPADRAAFLTSACAQDEDLRGSVDALLAQDPPPGFLAVPDGIPDFGHAAVSAGDLIGKQFGPYRIDSTLGSGGMGQVFRAQDTTLRRDVAIKVLPLLWTLDRERRTRFEREARVLATLNHPHIGAIYGTETVHGALALILELVEGETLAEHIARRTNSGGGLPLDQAVAIARQIADALETAHDKGIVHRDLKPGNIKVAANGSVKVLDFGLASSSASELAVDPDGAEQSAEGLTRTGVVMGTAAYMSPEQARGERVDKRADVWAFGCVLYEMLTGRPAFAKATAAETVAAVLREEPQWRALPAGVPPAVRTALECCLRKDVTQRFRDVGDVRLALSGAFTPISTAASESAAPSPRRRWPTAAMLAMLVIGSLVTIAAIWLAVSPEIPRVVRLSLVTRGDTAFFAYGNGRNVTVTPDGARVVYVGNGGRQLFVRRLDQLEPVAIAATPLGPPLMNPVVSPDGQWVAFGEGFGFLKKVPIGGGPAITVATLNTGFIRGAVWLPDDTIVFSTNFHRGLLRVPARGGTPAALTTPDTSRNEHAHLWPDVLPDGRSLLFTVFPRTKGLAAAKTVLYDMNTRTSTDLLFGGTNAVYLSSGHLAYIANSSLWVVPFDPRRRSTTGQAVRVQSEIVTTGNGAGDFAVSSQGTLVYAHASGYDPFARTLSWIDREGRREPLPSPPHPYLQIRISHDGTKVATLSDREPENNIWVLDLARQALTRVTTDAALDIQPAWTSDDRSIVFASNRDGSTQNLWRQAADGTGVPERLTFPPGNQAGPAPTPDGTRVIFATPSGAGDNDVMEMTLDATRQERALVKTPFNDAGGALSPNARWLAYQSNRTGRTEVYVTRYPDTTRGGWQVSTDGGATPRWSKDGTELFFSGPGSAVMSARVTGSATTWAATAPAVVMPPRTSVGLFLSSYDVSPDGKRVLVVDPPVLTTPDLVVVQHWNEELKTLLPQQ
jgi:serine/threonine protein kinase/Tol biopolymer transport system component